MSKRKISDKDQAEFAAGHIRDTSLSDYESGLLSDLVREAVTDQKVRKAILDYYLYIAFLKKQGKLK
ncbi:MAG: hypothetical protein R6V10_07365 [bacterium]